MDILKPDPQNLTTQGRSLAGVERHPAVVCAGNAEAWQLARPEQQGGIRPPFKVCGGWGGYFLALRIALLARGQPA